MLRSIIGVGWLLLTLQEVSYFPFLRADGGNEKAAEHTEDELAVLV
jgi:hypothetical protein